MEEQLPRHGIHAAAVAQVRLERVKELVVPVLGDERTERALRERADLLGRLRQDEAERAELVEVDGLAVAAQPAADGERVLRLEEGKVRARLPWLGPGHARGDVIRDALADQHAQA